MYINYIDLENFRTFEQSDIEFVHPSMESSDSLRFKNINVILGNNGQGKTTLLKGIALACLGPAIASSGLLPYRLIRNVAHQSANKARIDASLCGHKQDLLEDHKDISASITVTKRGDVEIFGYKVMDESQWEPIFSEQSDAFFFVGYGATRTVEKSDKIDFASRAQSSFLRARRIKSLFEETYSLVPLNAWLPELKSINPGRYKQVFNLINRLLGENNLSFTGEQDKGDYLFEKDGIAVPFPALSDGYRAFLGWIGDLLYNVTFTCPSGVKLVENCGIVLIDEIDLHLHPKWQMKVLPTLSKALPNIQFIVTTHSPLVVGSVDSCNVIAIKSEAEQGAKLHKIPQPIHGLDADQILLTECFGLSSTISDDKAQLLKQLTEKARLGDVKAASELLELMSGGVSS